MNRVPSTLIVPLELWHEPLDRQGTPSVQTLKIRVIDGKPTQIKPVLKL